jgi:hypothetical protein
MKRMSRRRFSRASHFSEGEAALLPYLHHISPPWFAPRRDIAAHCPSHRALQPGKVLSMNDARYRWQDHVPPTVNAKAYLLISAAIVVMLGVAGLDRARTENQLYRAAVASIKTPAVRRDDSAFRSLFVTALAPAHAAPQLVNSACAERSAS